MYDIISNLWCHDICPSPPPRQERTSCHQAWPPQVCTCNQVKSLVRSIVWDYLRSAMQATNSQTFLATSYLKKMTELFSNGRYLSTLLVFSVLACHPPTWRNTVLIKNSQQGLVNWPHRCSHWGHRQPTQILVWASRKPRSSARS